ncbi:Histone-lysine N-methyltransferase, H3 lysine-79 specific [Mycena chlorophos]|uniref:Histone-lysine N-methyltransferase, H3 lysine-79 specific n=1 Tax=Mycena chlorophos TaxID=658473 RepID=A0A8H6TKG9_MYCCL|nr:Histone-lysine N-methyltransferase, H3 lysine-79 specific [Mycena chlorophos]
MSRSIPARHPLVEAGALVPTTTISLLLTLILPILVVGVAMRSQSICVSLHSWQPRVYFLRVSSGAESRVLRPWGSDQPMHVQLRAALLPINVLLVLVTLDHMRRLLWTSRSAYFVPSGARGPARWDRIVGWIWFGEGTGIRGWACTCSSTSLLLPPNLISGRLPEFIRLVVAHDVARAISSRQPAASAPMGLGLRISRVDILQSSEATVRANIRKYRYYFHNPQDLDDGSWHPHPQRYPTVSLHYPNGQTPERFILLAPRDPNEYAPIMDLESSIYTIAEHYFTAE